MCSGAIQREREGVSSVRASESISAKAVCISAKEYKCQEDEVLHLR